MAARSRANTSFWPRIIRSSGNRSLAGATLFQTKLALYTSYVVAGRIAKGTVPDALLWDTADPYHFFRIDPQRDHDLVIDGGEDHKTGQADDTAECYARRRKLRHAAWDYLRENKDYPYYLIRDRFAGAEERSLRAVKRGEGKIIECGGEQVARSRISDTTSCVRRSCHRRSFRESS